MARSEGLFERGKAFNTASTAHTVDITKHNGYDSHLPDISAYSTNNAYVKRNLIAVVLATPKGFDLLPDSEVWHRALKAIIETQSKAISGITSTLAVEFTENAVGGAGEVQSDVSNVTRAPSTPTHTVVERPGKPIAKLWDGWILNLLGDPETKVPRCMTFAGNQDQDIDLLPDQVSCTVLYFEPDHTFRHVVDAWLCTDMKPKNGTANEGVRDLSAGGAGLEHSLEFTSIQQVGANVIALAQAELDAMNIGGVNPDNRPAIYEGRTQTVKEADQSGYAEGIAKAAETFNNTVINP